MACGSHPATRLGRGTHSLGWNRQPRRLIQCARDSTNREQSVIEEGELIAGHYRLLECVGSGAMGVVWRARDERLERIVAVKQLLLQPGLTVEQRQDARRRAMREARIAARLHHANAIVVFDVAEHEGDPCLIMEYLESRSLAAVLTEHGSLAVPDVAALGSQIAAALAAAHARGIVHRDIKPGNVLISQNGTAKITDFGIARAVGDITLTQTGTFAGTPAYLAPEVARGQDPTPASDVFSLGATLYDAVEGGPPFPERQNPLALLQLVAAGKVQPPKQAGALSSLLMKLLCPDPADRPTMSQASELLAALTDNDAHRPAFALTGPEPTRPDLAPAVGSSPRGNNGKGRLAQTMPAGSPRPVAGARPAPMPSSETAHPSRNRRRAPRMAVAIAAVVLAGVGLIVAIALEPSIVGQGGPSGTVQPSTSAASPPPGASSGTIQYQPAGQLVIDYYAGMTNPASVWSDLSAGGQQIFGGESAFERYWGQFPVVYAAHAQGVTPNPDGSVNVPVDITYGNGSRTQDTHKVLRVIQQNGRLLIDADTRVPANGA